MKSLMSNVMNVFVFMICVACGISICFGSIFNLYSIASPLLFVSLINIVCAIPYRQRFPHLVSGDPTTDLFTAGLLMSVVILLIVPLIAIAALGLSLPVAYFLHSGITRLIVSVLMTLVKYVAGAIIGLGAFNVLKHAVKFLLDAWK